MLSRAAARPGARLSDVFVSAKERDAAYDFVESDKIPVRRLEQVVGQATARNCIGARVFAVVDGSCISLSDHSRTKFGPVGTVGDGGRGIKVITALAVDGNGAPVGVLGQQDWVRKARVKRRTAMRARDERGRKSPAQKESGHWCTVIERSAARLTAAGVSGWFQLDREGDAWPMLLALAGSEHWFTVRGAWNRLLASTGKDKQYLRASIQQAPIAGYYDLDVVARKERQARTARMEIRTAKVTLMLRDKSRSNKPRPLALHVVWTHEVGTTPDGERPIDWMLLTNAPVETLADAREVVRGYSMRWRIEEFHRTWKSGACDVEATQLRTPSAVMRWATILAVVAARVERLKRLAREQPETPASEEMSELEIGVLIAMKRDQKKRTETVPAGIPTIGQATRWIADLGGYTGKSSGGPPGAVVIARGLERLLIGVEASQAYLAYLGKQAEK